MPKPLDINATLPQRVEPVENLPTVAPVTTPPPAPVALATTDGTTVSALIGGRPAQGQTTEELPAEGPSTQGVG